MAVEYILWHYTPSVAAAGIFALLFAVLTLVHIVRFKQTQVGFCIPFIVGGILEGIGYGARVWAHYNLTKTFPYATQSLLILLGPIFFAASVYMILGRIILSVRGEEYSIIRPKRLTKIFVAGDVTCFLIQGGGGGMLSAAKSQDDINRGQNIILGGLIFQIVVFGIFVLAAGIFHVRMRRSATSTPVAAGTSWEGYLLLLYAVSILITVRNVFRAIEYATGADGFLLTHEWPMYVFDAALMVIVMSVCTAWYATGLNHAARLPISDGEEAAELTRFK